MLSRPEDECAARAAEPRFAIATVRIEPNTGNVGDPVTPPVLIIDDELAIRRLVRGALERGGFACAEAATAAEALSAARHPGCKLVLLDLGLPDRDGMELIPLIKAMDRALSLGRHESPPAR